MKQLYNTFSCRMREKNFFRRTIFGIALLLGVHNTTNAQVSSYSFAQSSGSFSSIAEQF